MAQLRQEYNKFTEKDTQIVVIGPETSKQFSAYWKMTDTKFIGLPDPDHRILKLYGQEINLFKLGRMPAQLIIDKKGFARYVHYGKSMSDIPPIKDILTILDELNMNMRSTADDLDNMSIPKNSALA